MLQDEIIKLGEYFRGIEYYNDAIIVKVTFPIRWQVYPSANGFIKPAKTDNQGEYYYYGDMSKVTLDDIFNVIEETISANKDAELKIQLLSDKINEIKELFKITPYEKLLGLKFAFEEAKKEKPKRKYTRKKKTQPEASNEATEEDNTTTSLEETNTTENEVKEENNKEE